MYKVAQCWDDGVLNDLRLVPLLRRYHAKATFNLNPGLNPPNSRLTSSGHMYQGVYTGKLAQCEFKSVYEGFLTVSHGMHHYAPCHVSPEIFIRDAVDGRKFLEDLWQKECPGYVWPGGVTSTVCRNLLEEAGFAYGRTIDEGGPVKVNDPLFLSPSCHYQSPQFFDFQKKAREENGIFYFWGHSYEMLDDEGLWGDLERKLRMIDEDPEAEWIDVIDIVRSSRSE